MAFSTEPNGNAAGVIGMFGRVKNDFAAYRTKRAKYRQTMSELESLSDRELNDLGIGRADITRVAREAL